MIGLRGSLELLLPYLRQRLMEQVRAVAFIVAYLLVFQIWVLKIPIMEASTIAGGIALVVLGLALFIEGLKIGLMPLGENLGLRLPSRSPVIGLLLFAMILGIGATFAEPAISVLRASGASVKAWEAPLLFYLLNKETETLVYSVALGVGLAVVLGMLRFLYNWSLKPLLYILVPLVLIMSGFSLFDANMSSMLGLAWDCGAVTTGPVTVPLVLALGIGISRVVSGHTNEGSAGGFGVVTLASLLPIIMVLGLGIYYKNQVPQPMSEEQFFSAGERSQTGKLFHSEGSFLSYAMQAGQPRSWETFAEGKLASFAELLSLAYRDPEQRKRLMSSMSSEEELLQWLFTRGDFALQLAILGSKEKVKEIKRQLHAAPSRQNPARLEKILKHGGTAAQAILPLSLFLFFVFRFILRERLEQIDELLLGIVFALIGMTVFLIGLDLGLSRLGSQVGSKLPAAYSVVELSEQERSIEAFDPEVLQTALRQDGQKELFFYVPSENGYTPITFHASQLDELTGEYRYVPTHGPIFGDLGRLSGIVVVLFFAFLMGYGATLAEPALNTLGATVEELTVGTFKKTLLIQTVGAGVGVGLSLGIAKIIWDLPLFWMLAPLYVLLLFLSALSSEQFVNIGWDSAGVTTGPITVPLVLAMGLGIDQQSAAIEGFGLLSMASVAPILAVLIVGIAVNRRQEKVLSEG